ncbi:MAG: ribokinase [Spirochaetaceae bacterium]|nr:MAG: ribokinase [Spirochaetaceae bacterium]
MTEQDKKLPLLVVGSVNMDLVMQLPKVPQGGETLLGQRYSYVPGGKGANQAVAAARLDMEVTFVGKIGADAHGSHLKECLEQEGIATRYLLSDTGDQTGFAAIFVEADGQNRIVVFPGANMAIQEQEVAAVFAGSPAGWAAVLINLEIPQSIVLEVCRLAREKDLPIILDAGPIRDLDFTLLHGLEIISPNETETQAITGIECRGVDDAVEAAGRLVRITQSRYAVIKLGERGALIYDAEQDQPEYIKGYPVQAVDSTAAGDAFTAAMTAHFLRYGELAEAVRYANAAGALAVTRLGAQPSLPTGEQVRTFVRERGLEIFGV